MSRKKKQNQIKALMGLEKIPGFRRTSWQRRQIKVLRRRIEGGTGQVEAAAEG